jgi:hypothetical protein
MSVGGIDFSFPVPIATALVHAALLPFYLMVTGRFERLAERGPLRFMIACIITVIVWCASMALWGLLRPSGIGDVLAGLAVLAGAMLFYLEAWSLLTRGYTLGILLTLLKEGRPLEAHEIALRYRSGDGLSWVMRHRLGGLAGARMVRREQDQITLDPVRGVFIARLYRLCIATLGLKRTG